MTVPPASEQNASPSEETRTIAALKDHWRKVGYEFSIKSVERIEEAARQLVALNGTLQGLYLAVFAFSNLRDYATSPLALIFLVPMALSVASMIFATRVYVPRIYVGVDSDDVSLNAWMRFSTLHRQAAIRKHRHLYRAHWLLISSFALLIVCIGVALRYPPEKSAPAPTQIVIVTPTPASASPSAPIPSPTP